MKRQPERDHCYYRATAKARLPGIAESICCRSRYLYDVLMMCLRGAWDLELRQFMPPASLLESLASLLELGLIERLEGQQLPDARYCRT